MTNKQNTNAVYRIRCPEGKCYYGISVNVKERWSGHKNAAKNGNPRPLYQAMRIHGSRMQIDVLIKGLSRGAACELEKQLVAQTNSQVPGGYNLAAGGGNRRGYHHPTSIQKMRKIQKHIAATRTFHSRDVVSYWTTSEWIIDPTTGCAYKGQFHTADMLGISRTTLGVWLRKGRLHYLGKPNKIQEYYRYIQEGKERRKASNWAKYDWVVDRKTGYAYKGKRASRQLLGLPEKQWKKLYEQGRFVLLDNKTTGTSDE